VTRRAEPGREQDEPPFAMPEVAAADQRRRDRAGGGAGQRVGADLVDPQIAVPSEGHHHRVEIREQCACDRRSHHSAHPRRARGQRSQAGAERGV
jgi:hypothetical protein